MTGSWKYAERTKKMNPIDDEFFRKMAEDIGFCQEILQVILQDKSLEVQELIPQKAIKNLQGRSVILDALCKMQDGSYCHVEVQKADDDDHLRRVRYDSSCITANISDTGIRFKDVPDVCVIYISRSDIFKAGKTLYHVDSVIRETGEIVDDGLSRIFVNATVKDDSDISELMDVFTKSDRYDFEKFPKISARKYLFKEDEKGEKEMSEIMREIAAEERAEGRAEGRRENLISLVMKKYATGQSVEQIATDLMEGITEIEAICRILEEAKAEKKDFSVEEILERLQ